MHFASVVEGVESHKDILADTGRVTIGLSQQRFQITARTEFHHDIWIAANNAKSQ